MMSAIPIGTVSPFAGQVDPVSGAQATVWSATGCPASTRVEGGKTDSPLNHLESQGWMLCDGRSLGVASYPELHAVLGFLYGEAGSGAEFRIPDYRGAFLRGLDAGAGIDPDAGVRWDPTGNNTANVVGSLQCDALQDHTHLYDITSPAAVSQSGQAAGTNPTKKQTEGLAAPARFSTETRPRNIAVNYIIKFR